MSALTVMRTVSCPGNTMQFIASPATRQMPSVLPLLGVSLLPALLVLAMVCFSLSREEETIRLPTGTLPRPPMVRETPTISVRLSRQGAVTLAGQSDCRWRPRRGLAARARGLAVVGLRTIAGHGRRPRRSGRAHRQGPAVDGKGAGGRLLPVRAPACGTVP